MLHSSPLNINKDIFKVLPNDLVGEILSFSSHVEILLNHAKVCQYWKTTCHEIIWKYYENRIQISCCEHVEKFDEFLNSKLGRKFIRYLIRRHVYDLAGKLKSITTVGRGNLTFKDVWVDTELSITKRYFKHFTDLKDLPIIVPDKPMTQPKNDQSLQKGFFSSVFSAIGSWFSKSTAQSSADSSVTPRNEILSNTEYPKQYDPIFKLVVDGNYLLHGESRSFVTCGMYEKPVDHWDIDIKFSTIFFNFGDTKGKLQLCDKTGLSGYYSYYRNSSIILLLVNPFNKASIEAIPKYLQHFKTHAPKADVILITTKRNNEQERLLTNEQAELIAFDSFGGLHLDITCYELDEPRQIIIYSILLKYFLLP